MPFLDEMAVAPGYEVGSLTPPPNPNLPAGMTMATAPTAESRPALVETLGAAFRQDNLIGSFFNRKTLGVDNEVDQTYDPWTDIAGTKYEQHWKSFAGANNARYAEALKRQIDMETDDRRTLDAAGIPGVVASLAAGIADPTILIPGGGVVRGAKGAYSVSRSALLGATAVGAAVAAQEAGLQSLQELRTAQESAVAIGGSVLLGGLLGGTAAALLGRAEAGKALRAHEIMGEIAGGQRRASNGADIGAAVIDKPTSDDLAVAGWLPRAIADKTKWLSPTARSHFRASSDAAHVTGQLAETTLYRNENLAGRTSFAGGAAETEYKVLYQSRLGSAVDETDDIYRQMKKAGQKMSTAEFHERIGNAMRNGDVDPGNEYVSRAASVWRSKVIEPFKEEAVALKLLPEDVSVETAASYLSRVYNKDMLTAREFEFKDRVVPWMEQKVARDYAEHQEKTTASINALKQDIADLKLSAEDRAAQMKELEARGSILDDLNAEHVDRLSDINDLRQKRNQLSEEAKTAGYQRQREIEAERRALQGEIQRIRAEGGDGLKAYEAERRRLRRRMRNVDMGFAGVAARAERIYDQLADVDERVYRSMERLVKKGQIFEREARRWDPDTLAAKIEEMRDAFDSVATQADDIHYKAVTQAEQMRQRAEKIRLDAEEAAQKFKAQAKEAKKAGDLKQPALEQKAFEARQKAATVEAETEERVAKMLDESQRRFADRSRRMEALKRRIEAAENLDPQAIMAEVREAVDMLRAQVAERALQQGEKAQRLQQRLANLDPKIVEGKIQAKEALMRRLEDGFYTRWEQQKLGEGVDLNSTAKPNFTEIARMVVDDVFDKISGRGRIGDSAAVPDYMVAASRGPMKERTFNVPDELIKDFLVSDIREVGDRYARTMAGEVSLAKRFGRADMRDQIAQIRDSYKKLGETVNAAKTVEEALGLIDKSGDVGSSFRAWMAGTLKMDPDKSIKGKLDDFFKGDLDKAKERILEFLQDDLKGAIEDVEALRDLIRGTYKTAENASGVGTFVRRMNAYNYIRLSGGFLISSLNDFFHAALGNGMSEFVSGGLRPLLTNLKAVKLSAEEAKLAGLIAERALHHKMYSLAELGDPFARGTAFDRFLANGSRLATKFNGMALFQDVNETIASLMTQNRLFKGVLNGKDEKWLSQLGLDATLRNRIADQFRVHGEVMDGAHIAHTQNWTDQQAVMAFRNAIQKYTTTLVVKPGLGDVPLFARTPLGKALLQFRSFSLSAHQRTMLRSMQEGPQQFLSGIVGTAAIGGLVAYLAAVRGGQERLDKWLKQAENPGFFLGEALDRAGMMPLLFEMANATEKASLNTGHVFNPIKTPLQAAFPGAPQGGESGRTMGRDFWSAIGGPSVGLPTELLRAAGGGIATFSGEDANKMQKRALQGLTPFGTFLGVKEVNQMLYGDSPWLR